MNVLDWCIQWHSYYTVNNYMHQLFNMHSLAIYSQKLHCSIKFLFRPTYLRLGTYKSFSPRCVKDTVNSLDSGVSMAHYITRVKIALQAYIYVVKLQNHVFLILCKQFIPYYYTCSVRPKWDIWSKISHSSTLLIR